MTKKDLVGRKVAITGGARGIGAATARLFAERGAWVSLGDVDAETAQRTAAMITADTGSTVVATSLDVTDSASFAKFLEFSDRELFGLDVLINNAGIMPTGEFLDESEAVTDRQIDINIRGVITGSKLAGRKFVDNGNGHIVNIASVAGVAASPGVAVYCATKHAVVGLGAALHQELAPKGVKVTTICPGFVNTELIAGLSPNWLVRQIGYVQPEDVAKSIVDAVSSSDGGQRFVPKIGGATLTALSVIPENLRNSISKVLGTQHVTLNSDESVRGAYRARTEQRATAREVAKK